MPSGRNGHRWRTEAAAARRRDEANQAPCIRCGQPIDYTRRHTRGHVDRWAWTADHYPVPLSAMAEDDPRRCHRDYLAGAHQRCNASHGATIGNRSPRRRTTPPTVTRWL